MKSMIWSRRVHSYKKNKSFGQWAVRKQPHFLYLKHSNSVITHTTSDQNKLGFFLEILFVHTLVKPIFIYFNENLCKWNKCNENYSHPTSKKYFKITNLKYSNILIHFINKFQDQEMQKSYRSSIIICTAFLNKQLFWLFKDTSLICMLISNSGHATVQINVKQQIIKKYPP